MRTRLIQQKAVEIEQNSTIREYTNGGKAKKEIEKYI